MTKPIARHLLMNLLLAAEHDVLGAAEAVKACELFGISQNNARVALARLLSAGLIESVERGVYRLGPAGRALGTDVAAWREAKRRTRRWDGSWVVVSVAGGGRSDRGALRRRERALTLVGLRELDAGLYVRPDNLADGIDGTRERLYALGVERRAPVFIATGFDAEREARARRLWKAAALLRAYRSGCETLERSMARFDRLGAPAAAREAFELGDRAVRQLVFDPWLPEPLIDASAREAFIEMVRRYDAAGTRVWRRFMRDAQTAA